MSDTVRVGRDDYARLVALPHGTRVWAGPRLLTVDQESPRFCLRDTVDYSFTYAYHVHDEYDVDHVVVELAVDPRR
jgi:hypothetical protein